jgi:hypothetical protein
MTPHLEALYLLVVELGLHKTEDQVEEKAVMQGQVVLARQDKVMMEEIKHRTMTKLDLVVAVLAK